MSQTDTESDRRPLLTPTDVDRLAEAIRRGSAQEGPSGRRMASTGAVAVVFLVFEIVILNHLLTAHPAQRLDVSTSQLDELRHVTMGDPAAQGRWVMRPVTARSIGLFDPRGTVVVQVPVPVDRCDQLARLLGSTCSNGAIALSAPMELRWSRVVRVVGAAFRVSRLDLGLATSGEAARQFDLGLVTTSSGAAPILCVSQPVAVTRLTLTVGSTTAAWRFRAGEPPLPCQSSIRLLVGQGDPATAGTTSVELGGTRTVNLTASGTSADLNSVAGRLTLVGVSSRVLDPAAHVIVSATPAYPLATSLVVDRLEERASVTSHRSTSVLTDDGQFLPTPWDRRSQIYLPVLAGVFSVLVLSPLSVVIPYLMGLVVGRPSRRKGGARP